MEWGREVPVDLFSTQKEAEGLADAVDESPLARPLALFHPSGLLINMTVEDPRLGFLDSLYDLVSHNVTVFIHWKSCIHALEKERRAA